MATGKQPRSEVNCYKDRWEVVVGFGWWCWGGGGDGAGRTSKRVAAPFAGRVVHEGCGGGRLAEEQRGAGEQVGGARKANLADARALGIDRS